jgi:hypothetical protein
MKLIIFLLFFLTLGVQSAERCSVCSSSISGKYLKDSKGKAYCQQSCFDKKRPKCVKCSNFIKKTYKLLGKKVYCSNRCLNIDLPKCFRCKLPFSGGAKLHGEVFCKKCITVPKCFSCNFPAVIPLKKKDGRVFCEACHVIGTFKELRAKVLFRRAVIAHFDLTGKALASVPPLVLASYKDFSKKNANTAGVLRGYYHHVENIETTKRSNGTKHSRVVSMKELISIVDGLSEEDFLVTAIHELTHDWLGENYPGIKVAPLWLEEGVCQYLAFEYALKMKYKKSGRKIMDSPDKIYGKGFKFFSQKFGYRNWSKVLVWLEQQGYLKKPPHDAQRPSGN